METTSATTQSTSVQPSDLPFRNTATQESSDTFAPMQIKVPDGRRNSQGEKIPSPVETWKPNFARRQSWNREDLKREHVMSQLTKKNDEGMGAGFTEVGN